MNAKTLLLSLSIAASFAATSPAARADTAITAVQGTPARPTIGKDLYIRQDKFRQQFAADVAPPQAAAMAVAQRPVTAAALNEPATGAGWKQVPSYFVYGTADRNIPLQALRFMAERAQARGVARGHGLVSGSGGEADRRSGGRPLTGSIDEDAAVEMSAVAFHPR
jgi:pimeloyl-ACP methyl ester carboxylesterase